MLRAVVGPAKPINIEIPIAKLILAYLAGMARHRRLVVLDFLVLRMAFRAGESANNESTPKRKKTCWHNNREG